MSQEPNYYALLGLQKNASMEEIRRAYRDLARHLHPDTNSVVGATELFLKVQEAYTVLSDPEKRKIYDTQHHRDIGGSSPIAINTMYSRAHLQNLAEPQLVYAIVELTAQPDSNVEISVPINLCLVLDSSNSMRGPYMDTVKSTAIELIQQLKPNDLFSLVAFNDRAQVLIPSGCRPEVQVLENGIRMLNTGGGTEILKGLEAGFNEVRRCYRRDYLNHIILITDGRTYGDEAECLAIAAEAGRLGIGISALGIGNKWNDVFLDKLASATGRNSVYVTDTTEIHNFLKEKIIGLSANYANQVELDFEYSSSAELLYAFRLQPDITPLELKSSLQLGSLPRNKSISVLFEFLVDAFSVDVDLVPLVTGRLTIEIPTRANPIYNTRINLSLPVSPEPDLKDPPPALLQAISRLTLYRLQEQAHAELDAGNIESATRRLQYLATNLFSQGEYGLAKTVLTEAYHIQHQQYISEEGEKRIKYGTRALLLPESSPVNRQVDPEEGLSSKFNW